MAPSRTDDLVEIQQLLAKYAVTITQGDIEGLVSVFTADGTYSAFGETYALERFPVLVDAAPKGLFMTGTALIDLYNRPAVLQQGQQREVTEKTYGGWFMTEFETDVFGMRLTGNAGLRYVKTDQSSSGFASGTFVTVDRTYDDWLPSFNLNLHPTENLILRGAIAKVMTRPTLGSKKRRLKAKTVRGTVKSLRGKVEDED